jgi:YVTN family beta-propeller protein
LEEFNCKQIKIMKKNISFLITSISCVSVFLLVQCTQQKPAAKQNQFTELYKELSSKRISLPNGWSLTPAGKSIDLDDLPLNIIVSPSKKYLAVTNNGQSTQSIQLIDAAKEIVVSEAKVEKAYLGLAFSDDEKKLYASGGNDNKILVYSIENDKLSQEEPISLGKPWPKKISPTGISIDDSQSRLYVVTKEDSSLYICNTKTKEIISKLNIGAAAYTCLLSPDKNQLYISLWGDAKVVIIDTKTNKINASIETNKNPNDMILSQNGQFLFVANGNDNTVSVIDLPKLKIVETLTTSLYPNAPVGSTPNGLALSDDENTLYIANADNNCLAVFDVSKKGQSSSKGFIPTGWYPTGVKVIDSKIYVTNGKGFSSKANPKGPNPLKVKKSQDVGANPEANKEILEYIGGLFKGTLSIIKNPTETELITYSELVYANTPYTKDKELNAEGEKGNPIPMKVGEKSPIKYVFYIVKENRTYDQVLGDLKGGNGDASLCLFPEKTTPNQHALAKEFVLLDNFYVDAEVSADGHNWSSAAYANDYVEKNWVTSYGGRGGTYDYEGQKTIAYPRDGFIWDHCARAGISYRSYGWFADYGKASIPNLKNHICPEFKGYNLGIMDVNREEAWEKDFDELVAKNAVPNFNSLRFGNDHTSGARLGMPTIEAAVADNDLAVGRFVEHLSKSPIWKESVVFILEDDAQNGSDHVDAHRSIAFVAGGYVRRSFVNHTMYTTSGMLRTIELILGLKPMSQYDAAATPMWKCFADKTDVRPFKSIEAGININLKNVAVNSNSRKSQYLDFSKPDLIDDKLFSEIIWKTMKGEKSIMPTPRRGAFVKLIKKDTEEEDKD